MAGLLAMIGRFSWASIFSKMGMGIEQRALKIDRVDVGIFRQRAVRHLFNVTLR